MNEIEEAIKERNLLAGDWFVLGMYAYSVDSNGKCHRIDPMTIYLDGTDEKLTPQTKSL